MESDREMANRIDDPILREQIGSLPGRLQRVIGEQSNRQFADKIGVSETAVRGYLKGKPPKLPTLMKIARVGGVSLDWLCTGIDAPPAGEFTDEYTLIDGYHAEVSTGHGAPWEEHPVTRRLAFRKKWLSVRNLQPEGLKVVFAKGDSMEPSIHSGDTILVDTSVTVLSDGSIFVLSLGGDLYAKRLQRRFDGGVEILSDNKEYKDQVVPAAELDQLQIIGKVVWVGKDFH